MTLVRLVSRHFIMELVAVIVVTAVFTYFGIEIKELMKTIEEMGEKLQDASNGRTYAENRAIQSAILNGALLIRNYRADQRDIERLTRSLDLATESGISENIRRSEQALEDGKRRRDLTYELYRTQLVRLANDYQAQKRAEQLNALKQQFSERQKSIGHFAELYVNQAAAYGKSHVTEEAKLSREILDFQP